VEQQCAVAEVPVLIQEGLEMSRVGGGDASRRLHFDRQQALRRLDHEVHLLPGGRAPTEDLGAPRLEVAPGDEVREHQVLEMRP